MFRSAECYQKNYRKVSKKARERYQDLSEEKNNQKVQYSYEQHKNVSGDEK